METYLPLLNITQGILKNTQNYSNLLNSELLEDKILNSELDTQLKRYDTQLHEAQINSR